MIKTTLAGIVCVFLAGSVSWADDAPIFSGPQVTEKLPSRKLTLAYGAMRGKEVDVVAEAEGKPLLFEKFVHNDAEREAQLQRIADMLSKGRTRVDHIPAAKYLRRWPLHAQQSKATLVRLTKSARDESAGGIECYRVDTINATYFLDKVGAGLSSMIDRDGNDWIGFQPRKGSGAGGEYRGFPNAVYRAAGSCFHPQNAATDPCKTKIEESTGDRIVISAVSDNGQWAGRYTFTAASCTFTLA